MGNFLGLSLLVSGLCASARAGERWTQYVNTGDITGMADAGGQVWLGTNGGLIRIDKASAETTYFNQANASLTDLYVRTVASDGKGSVAAVTGHGALAVFDGRSWSNPGTETPLRGQFFLDAIWDAAGSFWLLATDPVSHLPSLFHKRDNQWSRIDLDAVDPMSGDGYGGYGYSPYLPAGFRHPSLQADREGQIWATVLNHMHAKVFRIGPDGNMDTLPAPAKGPYNLLVVPDSGAPVWLGAWGMVRAGSPDTSRLPVSGEVFNYSFNPRNRFARAPDGSELWSLALEKVHRRKSGVWDSLPIPGERSYVPPLLLPAAASRVPGATAPYVFVSAGKRFGTLDADAWTLASVAKTDFAANIDLSFFPGWDRDSAMLLSSYSGVETFDSRSGTFAPLYSVPPTSSPIPIALFADRSGRLWTSGYGFLGLLRKGKVEIVKPDDGQWQGVGTSWYDLKPFMAEDPAGTLWFADGSRLLSSPHGNEDTSSWIEHPLPAPWNGHARITAITAHRDGSIWIAALSTVATYSAGIAARFDGKTWSVHDTLPNDAFPSRDIMDLFCDGAGDVWLRFHDGMLQWNGTFWRKHLWSSSPLLGKGIVAMTVDGNGTLWAATAAPDATLLRWAGAQGWQSMADATAKMGTTPVRNMTFDAEGKLWMSTDQDGALVFDPSADLVSGIARRRTAKRGRPILSQESRGSWRIVLPGSEDGGSGQSFRILDIRGRVLRRISPQKAGGGL